MSKPIKPHRWWGITYINGNDIMPYTIRRTKKEAQQAVAEVSPSAAHDWAFWKSRGCRAIRVTVIVEPNND